MCAQQTHQHRYTSDHFDQDDIFTFFRDNLPNSVEICLPALLCAVCFKGSRVTSVEGNEDEDGVFDEDATINFQCGHSHPQAKLLQTWEIFPNQIGLVRFFTSEPEQVYYWEKHIEYIPPNDNGKVQALYVKKPADESWNTFKASISWHNQDEDGAHWIGGIRV